MIIGPQAIGTDASYTLTLMGPDGQTAADLSGATGLAATIWAGDNQPALVAEVPTVVAAGVGLVLLRVSAADTLLIATPGTYQARVVYIDASGHQLLGWSGSFAQIASPGTGPAKATYCDYQDMVVIAAWIGRLQDLAGDLAGFAGQRAQARQWVDDQALARRRSWLDRYLDLHGYAGRIYGYASTDYGNLYGYAGEWGDDDPVGYPSWIDSQIEGLRATIVAGTPASPTLLVDARIRRVAALWATSIVCEQQIGPGPGADGFGVLAAMYRERAIRELGPAVFRVDQNADGIADLVIV